MRIAVIQHSAGVGPAAMLQWLGEHQVSWHRVYAGEPLPSLEDFELLMLLDGSLSVHDERQHGWIGAEKCLIHQSLMARKRVFGSGLGAGRGPGGTYHGWLGGCANRLVATGKGPAIAAVAAWPHAAAASAGAALAA
ncbi:type 1 glutamine amidotransferase family protein [Ectopseudomonas mendocina]|uniref:hypothetical protein n=1 Tax=Ectopseudomonas mendocina TaxID=300 RepID=UPI0021B09B24|nr:hypothetical protein [Pseudomonas mendocina]